jgi:hypothetical protein
MTETVGQRAFDGESTRCPYARHAFRAAIMGGLLQLLERVDVQFVVTPGCQLRSKARYGLEHLLRFE